MGSRYAYAYETLQHAVGTTSADAALIAAPGSGNRIVVKELIVQNESATETLVLLNAASTTKWRTLLAGKATFRLEFPMGEEWRLGDNEALNIDLGGANSHGYSIRYYVEAIA